jgi:hypothetical protein
VAARTAAAHTLSFKESGLIFMAILPQTLRAKEIKFGIVPSSLRLQGLKPFPSDP